MARYTLNRVVPGRDNLTYRDDTGAYRVASAAWNGTTTVPYLTDPVIIAPAAASPPPTSA